MPEQDDDADQTGYVIYKRSGAAPPGMGHRMTAQKLTPDLLSGVGGDENSAGIFGAPFVEAPAMFKRKGVYVNPGRAHTRARALSLSLSLLLSLSLSLSLSLALSLFLSLSLSLSFFLLLSLSLSTFSPPSLSGRHAVRRIIHGGMM